MPPRYDGTIKIDSKIDTKGFNKGVDGMSAIFKKFAGAIVAFFTVKFVASAVTSVSKLSAEFQRLAIAAQAVGIIHGESAEQVKGFVKQLVDAGIQSDIANRAYINFAKNSLDTNLLPALARGAQDLAVFAEAGETSSDVLDRITYGILNLNQLMLRRANVTVDIMTAEKKYADQIGVTYEQLTLQQKRQAVTLAVLEDMKNVTGLYAKSQKTAAGQLASNTRIMNEFKSAIGDLFQAGFYKLIKGFNDLVKVMTRAIKPGGQLHDVFVRMGAVVSFLTNAVVGLFRSIAALFGVDVSTAIDTASSSLENNAGSAGNATEAQEELADATKKAGDVAKGALASFDELNVLQQDLGAGADTGLEDMDTGVGELGALDLSAIEDPLKEVEDLVAGVQERFMAFIKPVSDAIETYLLPVLSELGGRIWDGLVWVWENILKPFGAWFITELLPVLLKVLGAVGEVLLSVWEALEPTLAVLWEEILKPFGAWLGRVLIKILDWIAEALLSLSRDIDGNRKVWAVLLSVLGLVVAILVIFGSTALATLAPILALVAGIIALIFMARKAREIWKGVFEEGYKLLQNIINIVLPRFMSKFQNAFQSIGSMIKGVFDGVKNIIKGVVNTIIWIINGLIVRVANGINGIIYATNVVGQAIPGFSYIGYVRPTYIPYLASGAVIPPNAEFLAVLGDQRSGRNIEAPENLLRQIIQEEIGNIQVESTIKFEGSLAQLVRELKPQIDRESARIGKSMLQSGVVR